MTKNYIYVTRIFFIKILSYSHSHAHAHKLIAHLVATLGERDLTRQVHYFLHLGRINVKLVV